MHEDNILRSVVYLDLLGFKNWVTEDMNAACQLIENYRTVLRDKLRETPSEHPVAASDTQANSMAKSTGMDSFEWFLPFSDSILIISNSPNDLVRQLSTFLINSYLSTAPAHSRSDRTSDPTTITSKQYSLNNGQFLGDKRTRLFPTIFRGGISSGHIQIVNVHSVLGPGQLQSPVAVENSVSKQPQSRVVIGKPVVEAVRLEKESGKGPRISCGEEFRGLLNADSKQYFRPLKATKDHYELLWPAIHFQNTGHWQQDVVGFGELFEPAASLWHHFNHHSESGSHYFSFMRLIIQAALMFYRNSPYIMDEIECVIGERDLRHKKMELFAEE